MEIFILFNEFISQHTIIKISHNNMTGEYWPSGQHRILPRMDGME